MRLIVSVYNDISTDQRVQKTCNSLIDLGFEIYVIGRKKSHKSLDVNLKFKTHKLNLLFKKGFLSYAEFNTRLFFKLLFIKKDILLANDLDTLLPNFLVSKIFNTKLVYDSHELFTEMPELKQRPFVRKIWQTIEENIVPKVNNCYTVSNSIANYYNYKYNTNFLVIRNFPVNYSVNKNESPKNINTIIYQGSLNIGRGLELMFETIPLIKNTKFLIIGSGEIENELKNKVKYLNLSSSVKFIPRTSPNELKKITPTADLGISIEEDLGLSYRYALPNKLFDYIQAEIPVLVSNLPEMSAIVKKYNIGEVAESRNPQNLATKIEKILYNKHKYHKHLKAAKQELNWENESKELKKIYQNLK